MKTNEELNALKKEVENVNEKLHELTPDELAKVNGGVTLPITFESLSALTDE